MTSNLKLNYVELPAKNINATKQFFEVVFAWSFVDYGPDYTAFENAGIDGGFYRSEMTSRASTGAALLVLKTEDLEQTQAIVKLHGGIISTDIFLDLRNSIIFTKCLDSWFCKSAIGNILISFFETLNISIIAFL